MTTHTAPAADCYAPRSWDAASDAWLMRVAFGLAYSGFPFPTAYVESALTELARRESGQFSHATS